MFWDWCVIFVLTKTMGYVLNEMWWRVPLSPPYSCLQQSIVVANPVFIRGFLFVDMSLVVARCLLKAPILLG